MDKKAPDSRRKPVVKQTACVLTCLLLSLPGTTPVSADAIDDARHFLQRSGFAEPPDTVLDASQLDREKLVEQVLNNTAAVITISPPAWATEPLRERVNYKGVTEQKRRNEIKTIRQLERKRLLQLQHWWLLNLIKTDNPLHAKMILFWQNHFTSSHRKVKHAQLLYQQHQRLESHALGNFGDMIRDPAMLLYLDNNANNKSAPNENLAREVLELFTLGEGHYTENDIKEADRCIR